MSGDVDLYRGHRMPMPDVRTGRLLYRYEQFLNSPGSVGLLDSVLTEAMAGVLGCTNEQRRVRTHICAEAMQGFFVEQGRPPAGTLLCRYDPAERTATRARVSNALPGPGVYLYHPEDFLALTAAEFSGTSPKGWRTAAAMAAPIGDVQYVRHNVPYRVVALERQRTLEYRLTACLRTYTAR